MLKRFHNTLLFFFRELQTLRSNPENVALCFSIQERLIVCIRRVEFRLRKLKAENNVLGGMIKSGRLTHDEVTKLRRQSDRNYTKKVTYSQLLSILRDVGDGIAFIYLDKWDIKPLCLSKEHAGFISGKRGLRTELACFRHYQTQGAICILNDITHSIRHGDITVRNDDKLMIVEVKSGRAYAKNARVRRQIERGTRIVNYLVKDQGIGIYPGQGNTRLLRRELINHERHHRQVITDLLIEAIASQKTITRQIEPGLHYLVAVSADEIGQSLSSIPEEAKILAFFLNAEKYIKQAYYPFVLSIGSPESLIQFYYGNCVIAVFIDGTFLEQELSKQGVRLSINEKGDTNFLCLQNHRTGLAMHVSRHFFERVSEPPASDTNESKR